jgi:membrane protease YdiL (CAAX protease family)
MEGFPQSIEGKPSAIISAPQRSPLKFFLLVFALTTPFWMIGAATGLQLLPGLPVAALAVVCPVLAAIILVYQESKLAGVKALLMRSFDYHRIAAKIWFAPILFLLPVVAVLSFMLARAMGVPIPLPHITLMATLELLALFFVAALGEELGWSGYAIDPMQKQWHALSAGLLLGMVWAAWHIVALLETHRSLDWIAWWCLGTVTLRVVMVWLYNNTGKSVFAVALFHAVSNVCWQSFPIHGSYFDPRINGLIMLGVATVVTVVRGPRTPAKRGIA